MTHRRPLLGMALLAAWLASGAEAREDGRPFPTARTDAIESCVEGQAIRFHPEHRRVVLDAADAAAVGAALVRRYPIIERDGLAPQRIVLWRKPAAGWLYIALLENPARQGEVCYTATFVAARFDLTPALLEKYFGAGVANE
ncbi:MAG TPA: hypothetical protein VF308_08240 [Caldimonas sp.]